MSEWIVVITITVLAVISPGADFALVTRNSLLLSRRAGLCTAVGIGLGVLVHVAYSLLGLSWLATQSAWLFTLLKLLGALYLMYLGAGLLLRRPDEPNHTPSVAPDALAAMSKGFLTNVLNPKTSIFILSLFIQVIDAQTPLITRLAYGGFISAAHVIWFVMVALLFSAEPWRSRIAEYRLWLDRIFGTLLLGFGLSLGLSSAT